MLDDLEFNYVASIFDEVRGWDSSTNCSVESDSYDDDNDSYQSSQDDIDINDNLYYIDNDGCDEEGVAYYDKKLTVPLKLMW
jgi:hypothetical protein